MKFLRNELIGDSKNKNFSTLCLSPKTLSCKMDLLKHSSYCILPCQVALGQHPASNDEDEHEELLDDDHQGVRVHRNGDVLQVDRNLINKNGSSWFCHLTQTGESKPNPFQTATLILQ